jgi:secretion/DNA translocation related TadE-like protein
MKMPGLARSELGNASVLMAGILGVVLTLSSAALVIAGYALSHHRARAAADLSALSAAAAFQHGRDSCAQAGVTARQNSARVDRCSQVGDVIDFVVTVRVSVAARHRFPHLPKMVVAEAHAGPVSLTSGSLGSS